MERARCPAHEKNKQALAAFHVDFGKFRGAYEGKKPDLLKSLQVSSAEKAGAGVADFELSTTPPIFWW